MYYKKLTNNQLSTYKYPNLIAEIIESGYSIWCISDHMGLGQREQNDPEIWDKLTGKDIILCSEGIGLSKLFGVDLDYLFGKELKTLNGKPVAFWRWFDFNRKNEEESKLYRDIEDINRCIKENPYLLKFFKVFVTWNEEQLQEFMDLMGKRQTA